MSNRNQIEALTIEQRVACQSDIDVLTCSICLSLMTAPVKQCTVGHNGCGSCMDEVASTIGTCPQCRIPISNGRLLRSTDVNKILLSLKIHCVNHFIYDRESNKWEKNSKGCPVITTVEKSDNHQSTCKYNLVKCPFQGCNVNLFENEMASHIAQCQYQEKIPCPFGPNGTKPEVDQHIRNLLSNHIRINQERMEDIFFDLHQQITTSIELSLEINRNVFSNFLF
ncbi:hypothetical protein DFA_01906 [Cavenderia fasciculata]|uniref:RING-type domain-containing protein n=1 Tax=Cavenderia fasciculata TaxID=261658 RepID=F4PQQ9_CACFS|nr:uncharacterized protein DFA_01906 [Cavenderia fasciculata]EGG22017.1 hypothetical protein DFA_01906 [Cavenderia fasciculata]|eukprot:XP_004359868.1 hypothetical protein DFA_01906 [Cavenderia fasciculata]